eukprot:1139324-Pelagomonas_calceolata.AAC.1
MISRLRGMLFHAPFSLQPSCPCRQALFHHVQSFGMFMTCTPKCACEVKFHQVLQQKHAVEKRRGTQAPRRMASDPPDF